ncbi:MAG: Hpt domain-containing protein [Nitrospira sp. WS238]|nr:Hpt domain-containing protein [Nitrospira sp. WS238]
MMKPSQPESSNRLTVEISRDLEDIVPIFLRNREQDIRTLHDALTRQDFQTIQSLGHRLKGDGGGYGFDRISEIGATMEQAAKQQDHAMVEQQTLALEDYLRRVHVIYR